MYMIKKNKCFTSCLPDSRRCQFHAPCLSTKLCGNGADTSFTAEFCCPLAVEIDTIIVICLRESSIMVRRRSLSWLFPCLHAKFLHNRHSPIWHVQSRDEVISQINQWKQVLQFHSSRTELKNNKLCHVQYCKLQCTLVFYSTYFWSSL